MYCALNYGKYSDAGVCPLASVRTQLPLRIARLSTSLLRLALPIFRSLSCLLAAIEPCAVTITSFLHPSRPCHLLPQFAMPPRPLPQPSAVWMRRRRGCAVVADVRTCGHQFYLELYRIMRWSIDFAYPRLKLYVSHCV
jgi:hypothetical protein